jgi:hypothetical protein
MKYSICRQSKISDFFNSFDNTKSQITFDSLVTATDGYQNKVLCQLNNFFYYWHRQNCSRSTNLDNLWRLPEEPNDCSRADIARTYRLGDGF